MVEQPVSQVSVSSSTDPHIQGVILAGGQGSRLRPLTEKLPKPMAAVLGKPIMEHIVEHLARAGIRELVATLHYRPRAIQDHFGDGSGFGVSLAYTLENSPLGTAGSVRLARHHLTKTVLVIAGDALMDFDLGAFIRRHRESGARVSLCLSRVSDPREFGIVITDDDGRVQRFLEKPGPGEVFSDTVNTGIYLLEPEILDEIPGNESFDFSKDLFPSLLERGVPIFGFVDSGYWSDIGTLDQLRQAHWDFLDNKIRLPIPGHRLDDGIWVGESVRIATDARITGPCWLDDNVRIRGGAVIGPYAVLSGNVEVDHHAHVNRSVIMRNCFIGRAADVRNAVIAPKTIIESRCEIGDFAVIGSGCHLGREVVVKPEVLVWPDKRLEVGSIVVENLIWEPLLRPSIFGSRGASGLANLHITPEFAVALGKAFGTWVGAGRRVGVARDENAFSLVIKRALISGLMAVGVDVRDLQVLSTPATRFAVNQASELQGGVHVRLATDHPSVLVIELFDDDGLLLDRGARRKIEGSFHRGDFPKVSIDRVGELTFGGRVEPRYWRALRAGIDEQALAQYADKIIFHSEDPVAARLLTDLLGRSGLPPLRDPERDDPARFRAQTLEQIANGARLNQAMGLFIDRNAEALSLVDETGQLLDRERVLELLAVAFMRSAPRERPLFLAPDQAAFLAKWAQAQDRAVIATRKDPAAQLAAVQGEGGDEQEWLTFTHAYLGFDALAGALALMTYLHDAQTDLHQFERELPTRHRQALELPCAWDRMGRVMRELATWPSADIDSVPEGVRIVEDPGWAYVLPSADEPQLQVVAEAGDARELSRLLDHIQPRLRRLIDT